MMIKPDHLQPLRVIFLVELVQRRCRRSAIRTVRRRPPPHQHNLAAQIRQLPPRPVEPVRHLPLRRLCSDQHFLRARLRQQHPKTRPKKEHRPNQQAVWDLEFPWCLELASLVFHHCPFAFTVTLPSFTSMLSKRPKVAALVGFLLKSSAQFFPCSCAIKFAGNGFPLTSIDCT